MSILNRISQTISDVVIFLRIFCFCDFENISINILKQKCDVFNQKKKWHIRNVNDQRTWNNNEFVSIFNTFVQSDSRNSTFVFDDLHLEKIRTHDSNSWFNSIFISIDVYDRRRTRTMIEDDYMYCL